jgi:serine/threonine-protein kinase
LRFTILPSDAEAPAVSVGLAGFALSPDGRQLVYRIGNPTAGGPLMVRALDQLEARPLGGITNARQPFFSHDSRWVGFFDGAELRKVSLTGGAVVTICPFDFRSPAGATWGEDDSIIFATGDGKTGLWRISATGGTPEVLTTPDPDQAEEDHRFPSALPDGRGVLYTVTAARAGNSQVAVLDLKSGERKILIRGGSRAEYVETGHLVYATGMTLHAVRFDLARLEVIGDSMLVLESVGLVNGRANYAVTRTGMLAYVTEGTGGLVIPRSLVWVDRAGHEEAVGAPPRAYTVPRVSPDGRHIAVDVREEGGRVGSLWDWNVSRQTLTRLADGYIPTWTPDGARLVFQAPPNGGTLYWQAATGAGAIERLTTGTNVHVPTSITPDGTHVVGYQISPQTSRDLFLLRLPSPSRVSAADRPSETERPPADPLIATPAEEINAEVSPDGRYIAYQSNESGRYEVYLRTFPDVNAGRWQVSREGGTRPAWARGGRELFYLDAADLLTAVSVSHFPTLTLGTPTQILTTQYATPQSLRTYDVWPGDEKFLMMKENLGMTAKPASLVVVLNWFEELKRLVPTD